MTSNITPRQRQPNVCMRCGSDACKVDHRSDVLDFKGLTLEVDGLARTVCTACQYTWETDGQQVDNLAILRQAFVARRDEVRSEEGLLTGEQIAFVLSKLELSKSDAASIFGGGPNAFQKYITGDVLQSMAMDRLLRLTLAFGHPAITYLRLGPEAPLRLYAGPRMVMKTSSAPSIKALELTDPTFRHFYSAVTTTAAKVAA